MQRVTVTIGGGKQLSEVDTEYAIGRPQLTVVVALLGMVYRALQFEVETTIGIYRQCKHRVVAQAVGGNRCQGGTDKLAVDAGLNHVIEQTFSARGQPLSVKQRSGVTAVDQPESTGTIRAKRDQRSQCTGTTLGADYQRLSTAIRVAGVRAGQKIFVHRTAERRLLRIDRFQGRHIILDVDDKATAGKTIGDRITITIGGDQYAREIQRQAVVAKGFGVDTILLLMVQRALEREQVATIAIHLEAEDLAATFTSRRGERGAIRRDDVEQRNTAGAQAKCLQSRQRTGLLAQVETTTTIGAEVDQYIQCAEPPLNREGLFRLTAGLGIAGTQGIFMHQPTDHRLLRIGLGRQRHVILNIDDEQAFRAFGQLQRIAVAIGSGEQLSEVEADTAFARPQLVIVAIVARMIDRSLQLEAEAAIGVDYQGEYRIAANLSGSCRS